MHHIERKRFKEEDATGRAKRLTESCTLCNLHGGGRSEL
jgi:hypothetical protein